MAQFARPDSDVSAGSWTSTPLWSKLDEVTASATDLVTSVNDPSSAAFELGLTTVTDPVSSTGHIARVEHRMQYSGGGSPGAGTVQVEVYQGTTQIATATHTYASNTQGVLNTTTLTLTGGEADNITDYSDLRIRITGNKTSGARTTYFEVTWAELEVPESTVTLAPADATHNHTADNAVLTFTHVLVSADATHNHTADNVVLTQTHELVSADTTHNHTADNVTLTGAPVTLVAQDASHTHTVDNATLTAGVSPPTGITYTPGDEQVQIDWTVAAGATHTRIYRGVASGKLTQVVELAAPTATYTDTGLTPTLPYIYEVRSWNGTVESDIITKAEPWSFDPSTVGSGEAQSIASKLSFFVPLWEGTGSPADMVLGAAANTATGLAWESPEPNTGPKLDLVTASAPILNFVDGDKPKPTTGFTFLAKFTPNTIPDWTPLAYDTNIIDTNYGFRVRMNSNTGQLAGAFTFTTAGKIEVIPSTALVDDDTYFIFFRWSQGNDVILEIYNEDGTLHSSASNATVGAGDTITWGTSVLWFFNQEGNSARHWNNLVDYVGYTDEELTTTERDHIIANPYSFFAPAGVETTVRPNDSRLIPDYIISSDGGAVGSATFTVTDGDGVFVADHLDVASTTSGLKLAFDTYKAADIWFHLDGTNQLNFLNGTSGQENATFNTLNNLRFSGDGMSGPNRTILANSSTIANDTEPLSFTNCDNVIIEHMEVTAAGSSNTTSDGLDFDDVDHAYIHHVNITDARARALIFDGKDSGAQATSNVVEDVIATTSQTTQGDVFELLGAKQNVFRRIWAYSGGERGIQLNQGGASVTSDDNVIEDSNIIRNNEDGIEILSGNSNIVRRNIIEGNDQDQASHDGVEVSGGLGADNNAILNNWITDTQGTKTQQHGVDLTSDADATLVYGNMYGGNQTGTVNNNGTNTDEIGNVSTETTFAPTPPVGLWVERSGTADLILRWYDTPAFDLDDLTIEKSDDEGATWDVLVASHTKTGGTNGDPANYANTYTDTTQYGKGRWYRIFGTDTDGNEGLPSGIAKSDVVLVAADTTHNHTADNVTLVSGGTVELAPADTAHTHTADVVTLTQTHETVLSSTQHPHTAGIVTLTQTHVLADADAQHTHTADNVTLAHTHVLVAGDAAHTHTADVVTLTQDHTLASQDAAHTHTVDVGTLTQEHTLAAADATHPHTADNVTLAQVFSLVPADASHPHTVDGAALTQTHVIVLADSAHTHTVDNVTLTQSHVLTAADAAHTHTADNVTLSASVTLLPADTTHPHTADVVTLTQTHGIVAIDTQHPHMAGVVTLTQDHTLLPADATHTLVIDGGTLTQTHVLGAADGSHTHTADNVTLTVPLALDLADATHAHVADTVELTQYHTLVLHDASHSHTAGNVTLTGTPPPPITIPASDAAIIVVLRRRQH